MAALKKIPFFLLLLVLFFCLHGSVENFGSLNYTEVFFVGISVMAVIAILFFISWALVRKILPASLITFFISVWYFFFGALYDFIKTVHVLSFLQHYSVIIPFLLLVTFGWVVFLKKKPQLWSKLCLYFNVLLLIYIGLDMVKFSLKAIEPDEKTIAVGYNYKIVTNKPNVYFLLFDGYPGQQTLTDSFNFNNTGLHNFLTDNHFIQLPINSNYDYTLYSMSSVFNLRYVNDNYKVNKETQKDGQQRQQEIKDGVVFDIFKKMGYNILNYSVFDVQDLPGLSDENSFLLGHSILLTNKILLNRVRKDLTFIFTDDQIKCLPFLKNQSLFIDRNNNIKAIKLLEETVGAKTSKPIFCYAHFLMPHAPYFYDSIGRETNYKKMFNMEVVLNKNNFISYLKYTNRIVERIIKTVRAKDSSAVIILLSDHGVRSFPKKPYLQPSNFDNICYVYFPNKNYGNTSQKITNVNLFPYLFNTQFRQHLPFLKDTSVTYIPTLEAR